MGKKRKSKFWFKNEKELMRSLGLNPTPGSGNRIIKEDGQNEHLIAQLKSTEGSSITIKLQDVNTLIYNSTVTHKLPLFINQFIDGPILVSMRLQDIPEISKYLLTGQFTKDRFCDIIVSDGNDDKPKLPTIKTGNRKAVRKKLQAEKEKEFERIKSERKDSKWRR